MISVCFIKYFVPVAKIKKKKKNSLNNMQASDKTEKYELENIKIIHLFEDLPFSIISVKIIIKLFVFIFLTPSFCQILPDLKSYFNLYKSITFSLIIIKVLRNWFSLIYF